jgi:hypothetical protein
MKWIMLKLETEAKCRVKISHFALSDFVGDRRRYMGAAIGCDVGVKE